MLSSHNDSSSLSSSSSCSSSSSSQVCSPHTMTRRLRREEAGNLLKPPPGSQSSYSVQGLRKFILGSSGSETDNSSSSSKSKSKSGSETDNSSSSSKSKSKSGSETDNSSSSSPPEPSRSEKRRSILDHISSPFAKSSTTTKCSSESESGKNESKEKELPLSCGQLALVGELPSALLNLPTTAELLGEQAGFLQNGSTSKGSSGDLCVDIKDNAKTADVKQNEPSSFEDNDPLPKSNGNAGSTKDPSFLANDANRPLPGRKVTLVRKKSLSENCLLPSPRVQRRDGQVTTSLSPILTSSPSLSPLSSLSPLLSTSPQQSSSGDDEPDSLRGGGGAGEEPDGEQVSSS